MSRRYHDETEITSKKKEYTCIEEGDTFKLIIKQATTKLSGTYKCKAENDVGYKETTAKLSVYSEYILFFGIYIWILLQAMC